MLLPLLLSLAIAFAPAQSSPAGPAQGSIPALHTKTISGVQNANQKAPAIQAKKP